MSRPASKIAQSKSPIRWFGELDGIAYRYYDLRMNVVPLLTDLKQSLEMWRKTVHWWVDPTIKMRFVESGEDYWFIMGAESKRPESNIFFYKVLKISDNYKRFKKGHDGQASLRLGAYTDKYLKDSKEGDLCNCGHEAIDHDEEDEDSCLYKACNCKKFHTFQVRLSKRKKTVSDIVFISEDNEDAVRGDPLVWNCLYTNKYSEIERSTYD